MPAMDVPPVVVKLGVLELLLELELELELVTILAPATVPDPARATVLPWLEAGVQVPVPPIDEEND